MSYLSRLLTRNTNFSGISITSKYFYTNFAHKPINTPIKLMCPFKPIQISISPFTTIRLKPTKQDDFIEPGIMEHDKYNACLKRPLSPHIRIYKKQLTSLLSFCHRLTGLMMVFYVYVVTAGTWIWPDITTFYDYLETLDIYTGEYWWTAAHRTVKFLVAYPFCYHALNAIRHLSWDFGKLLGMNQIYSSGYFMQAMVIVFALALVFLVPFDMGETEEETAEATAPVKDANKKEVQVDAQKDPKKPN
ncbi:succinate dehydrogenase cytochrome b560 subunit, mitochondrial-like [Atheta coriaria]|uniref:succinate dehydrogenase cytochrome b560 subunit, mitochondrial-like n=1 Tax=Dalotia coriaria TaxID=877792 RepID=UPI0031F3B3DE